MVQIQLAAWEGEAAVLAGVAVPDEDIPAAEPDGTPRDPVVGDENQHPRDSYRTPDKSDAPASFGSGQGAPGRIVEQLILFVDRLGKTGVKEAESAARCGDVDRKKSTVQNKNAGVQHYRNPLRVMPPTLLTMSGTVNRSSNF
jgi:hypothetical protein